MLLPIDSERFAFVVRSVLAGSLVLCIVFEIASGLFVGLVLFDWTLHSMLSLVLDGVGSESGSVFVLALCVSS